MTSLLFSTLLLACSSRHAPAPEPCRESAVLPDVGERYECPSPATVAVLSVLDLDGEPRQYQHVVSAGVRRLETP